MPNLIVDKWILNSFIHSGKYGNILTSEQSLQPWQPRAMCYRHWCVCFSTERRLQDQDDQRMYLFSNPTKRHNSTGDAPHQVLPGITSFVFFFFQLLRQKAQQWIRGELNWNLPVTSSKNRDIRPGKSILYCIHHFWTSFFSLVTPPTTHKLMVRFASTEGLTNSSKMSNYTTDFNPHATEQNACV